MPRQSSLPTGCSFYRSLLFVYGALYLVVVLASLSLYISLVPDVCWRTLINPNNGALVDVSMALVQAAAPLLEKPSGKVGVPSEHEALQLRASQACKDCQWAFRESLGFFHDIPDQEWKLLKERAHEQGLYMYRNDPMKGAAESPATWLLNNVDPLFSCRHLRRVGGFGDGHKYVCDPHRLLQPQFAKDCLIYSVGSFGRYQLEDGLRRLLGNDTCEIHVFDPNPQYARPTDGHKNKIFYHAWGLTSSYSRCALPLELQSYLFYSLQETMQRLGHTGRRLDIFKIDCERCEWSTFQDWVSLSVDIRQILLETHGVPVASNNQHQRHDLASSSCLVNVSASEFFDAMWRRGFVPVSKECNSLPGARPNGEFFEWVFLRLDANFTNPQLEDSKSSS